jgi:endogenous inhibitor of DNA gyrase (YacG/DUF329 family)
MARPMDVECPYCGETVPISIDEGGRSSQRYVEDCPVCCRPIELSVHRGDDGQFTVEARRDDE